MPHDDADVIVFDTNGRAMSSGEAAAATAGVVALAGASEQLFVKIDSTLRGHVRATVNAALSAIARPPSSVVVCPAFPSQGRTVIDGRVCIDGLPIAAPNLHALFADLERAGLVHIPDVAADADIAAVVAAAGPDTVWVGSAGLAQHLALRLATMSTATNDMARVARVSAARVVVIAGSLQQRTARQVAHLDADTTVVVDNPSTRSFRAAVEAATADTDGLVLTGGATARAVLEILGIDTLHVSGEIEPGVPWALTTGDTRDISVVTKAGGFGDEFTLRHAVDFLRGA